MSAGGACVETLLRRAGHTTLSLDPEDTLAEAIVLADGELDGLVPVYALRMSPVELRRGFGPLMETIEPWYEELGEDLGIEAFYFDGKRGSDSLHGWRRSRNTRIERCPRRSRLTQTLRSGGLFRRPLGNAPGLQEALRRSLLLSD